MSKNNNGRPPSRANNIDQAVSKNIRARRVFLGISQQQLGEALGVSIQQVQKYEKATNRISSGNLYKIAKFLKSPLEYFFDQVGDFSNILGDVRYDEKEGNQHGEHPSSMSREKQVVSLIRAFDKVTSVPMKQQVIKLLQSMA
jgi:transcriptional regulator with XRE-family HTH domain